MLLTLPFGQIAKTQTFLNDTTDATELVAICYFMGEI